MTFGGTVRKSAELAALALLITGCTSGSESAGHKQIAPSQPVTSSASSVTSATTPASSSTVAARKRCSSSALSLTEVTRGAAAGNIIDVYKFTNTGPDSCSLTGYPGVSVLDKAGRIVQHPADREPGPGTSEPLPVVAVTLLSDGHAEFVIAYTDNVPNPDCATEYSGTKLRVYPPDDTTAIEVSFTESFCDLSVGPVALSIPGG